MIKLGLPLNIRLTGIAASKKICICHLNSVISSAISKNNSNFSFYVCHHNGCCTLFGIAGNTCLGLFQATNFNTSNDLHIHWILHLLDCDQFDSFGRSIRKTKTIIGYT